MTPPMDTPMSSPVTCHDVRARLAAYLAGESTDAESLAIERHASACAECEAVLEEATRLPVDAFAPPVPSELRDRTLAAVSARAADGGTPSVRAPGAATMRTRRVARWIAVASTLAAAAALFLVVRPDVAPLAPRPDSALAVAPAAQKPGELADVSARPEFVELERAANELKAELTKTPDDAELQAFLEAVNTRRMELERRVKDARS